MPYTSVAVTYQSQPWPVATNTSSSTHDFASKLNPPSSPKSTSSRPSNGSPSSQLHAISIPKSPASNGRRITLLSASGPRSSSTSPTSAYSPAKGNFLAHGSPFSTGSSYSTTSVINTSSSHHKSPSPAASPSLHRSPTKVSAVPSSSVVAERPPLIRKASGQIVRPSLKSSKSAPLIGTVPKYVHFDSKLTDIRLFLKAETPLSVKEDAVSSSSDEDDDDDSEDDAQELTMFMPNVNKRTQQESRNACVLEETHLSDNKSHFIGTVIVQNLAFYKDISVRYTFDLWKTIHEVKAVYKDSVDRFGNNCDRFSFDISLIGRVGDAVDRVTEEKHKTMFFCVSYNVNCQHYWDNNNGANFEVAFARMSGVALAKRNASLNGGFSFPSKFSWSMDTPAIHRATDDRRPSGNPISTSLVLSSSPNGNDAPFIKKPEQQKNFGKRYDFGNSLSQAGIASIPIKNDKPMECDVFGRRVGPIDDLSPNTLSSYISGSGMSYFDNLYSPNEPSPSSTDSIAPSFSPYVAFGNSQVRVYPHSAPSTPPRAPSPSAATSPSTTPVNIPAAPSSNGSTPSQSPPSRPAMDSALYYNLVNKYCFYTASPAGTESPTNLYGSSPVC